MLRSIIYQALTGFVVILLTLDIVPLIAIRDFKPNILLIFIFFMAHKQGVMSGQVVGFVLGLFLDLFSGQFLGIGAATNLITGNLLGNLHHRIMEINFKIQIVLVFSAAVLQGYLFYFFNQLVSSTGFIEASIVIWGSALYTCFISLLIFNFFEFIYRKFVGGY